jgi:hypothetical protein
MFDWPFGKKEPALLPEHAALIADAWYSQDYDIVTMMIGKPNPLWMHDERPAKTPASNGLRIVPD